MRIIFCDDDVVFLSFFMDKVKALFISQGENPELAAYTSGSEVLTGMQTTPADVIFLDIEMPDISGFEIAQSIEVLAYNPLIVFISGLDNMVYDSFRYRPFWFLRKSDMETLPDLIQAIIYNLGRQKQIYTFKSVSGTVSLPFSTILYFESDRHNVTLHAEDRNYTYRASIGDITKMLESYFFIRCHIGFLVNCQHIYSLQADSIFLDNGERIPISRANRNKTELKYMNYMSKII